MKDADLLAAVADQNVGALRALHERHAPWLRARLSIRSSDPSLVDEAIQDTFVVVWRKADSYRSEGDAAAWLWGIAIRRLMDLVRRRRLPLFERARSVESAEDLVLSGIGYGALGDAMRSLSPELVAVLQARVLDGLSTREAARLLGIPTGTVKTRLMRAKQQLREQLT